MGRQGVLRQDGAYGAAYARQDGPQQLIAPVLVRPLSVAAGLRA